jgi:hypothetical protein
LFTLPNGLRIMKLSPLVSVYSLTLLLSAALLFSVQPMFSKMVLPYLGGTPQVWNTCMLFFQVMLLGGYAYAHGTTKYLSIRMQAIFQIGLLALFTIVLPIVIPVGVEPPEGLDPTLWQLGLMLTTVGGPFFVLAASAPMLQRWFAASGDKDSSNPYFLYGASNLGSMTSLLLYPVLIEPLLSLSGQAYTWMLGYFVLIALTGLSAFMVWRAAPASAPARVAASSGGVTWKQRFLWLTLAFIPSSLMLGVTTFMTMDIAAVPMLWILPLAIYVGTFILVFARKQLLSLDNAITLQAAMLIVPHRAEDLLPLHRSAIPDRHSPPGVLLLGDDVSYPTRAVAARCAEPDRILPDYVAGRRPLADFSTRSSRRNSWSFRWNMFSRSCSPAWSATPATRRRAFRPLLTALKTRSRKKASTACLAGPSSWPSVALFITVFLFKYLFQIRAVWRLSADCHDPILI